MNDDNDIPEHRIGKFGISTDAVLNHTEQVAQMLALMQFVPTRVEHLPMQGQFLYEGFSPYFDLVKNGGVMPVYAVIMTQEDDGTISSVGVTRSEASPVVTAPPVAS